MTTTLSRLGPAARAQVEAKLAGKPKQAKYRNRKTTLDGIDFDSKAEAREYARLKLRQAAGEITNLRCQVPFAIVVNGVKVCTYIADFTYLDKDGKMAVVDVKGMKTPAYRIKKKLMRAIYGVEIVEVTK